MSLHPSDPKEPKQTDVSNQEEAADHRTAAQLDGLGAQFRTAVPPAPKTPTVTSIPPVVTPRKAPKQKGNRNWLLAIAAAFVMGLLFPDMNPKPPQPETEEGTIDASSVEETTGPTRSASNDGELSQLERDKLIALHIELGGEFEDIARNQSNPAYYLRAFEEYEAAFELDGYHERTLRALIRTCKRAGKDCETYKQRYDSLNN